MKLGKAVDGVICRAPPCVDCCLCYGCGKNGPVAKDDNITEPLLLQPPVASSGP